MAPAKGSRPSHRWCKPQGAVGGAAPRLLEVGYPGSGTPSWIWDGSIAVHVAALAAPTAPGVGQWSRETEEIDFQRDVLSVLYWNPAATRGQKRPDIRVGRGSGAPHPRPSATLIAPASGRGERQGLPVTLRRRAAWAVRGAPSSNKVSRKLHCPLVAACSAGLGLAVMLGSVARTKEVVV